jgi:hypothetical protein
VDVRAILAQAAQEGSAGIARWPDVYIALIIVHITFVMRSAWLLVGAIGGVDFLAHAPLALLDSAPKALAPIQWQRRILVRWEYHTQNFLGFVQLACLVILFRRF